ncbi:hypothetical protein [Aestuariivirga litoralis]|uniref:hypothetical protein n=1 Tax=Aestuariivirga litoralis TaxID=2650924 RepID=UPI0011B562F7|nr:hypothetical protein [Aestuariivirga litoralis]
MTNNDSSSQQQPEAGDQQAWAARLRELIRTRTLKKDRLDEPEIRIAIEGLAATVENGAAPDLRLEAAAVLGKAAEVSVPIRAVVQPLLEHSLRQGLPPVHAWGNAEDRFYLSKALSASPAAWVRDYAAAELARADVDEKLSRQMWAELAISRADSLSIALEKVARSLSDHLGSTPSAGDTANRKLIRIAEALTQTLLTADVPTGSGFGRALSMLMLQGGGSKGAEALRVREDAAIACLELLVQIVRLRFEALLDSDVYRAAGTIRGWWRPGRPPDAVERKADRLLNLGVDGLLVLCRQGIMDKDLRQAMVSAFGADRVNSAGSQKASSDPALNADCSHWLATGSNRSAARSNEVVREMGDHALHELIGQLLIVSDSHDGGPQTLRGIADSLEVFEPSQASTLRSAADRSALINQWVAALAAKRRISLSGRKGEVVSYDPLLHECSEVVQRSANVRMVVPAVMLSLEGRSPEVVIKAIVEKA